MIARINHFPALDVAFLALKEQQIAACTYPDDEAEVHRQWKRWNQRRNRRRGQTNRRGRYARRSMQLIPAARKPKS